MAHLVQSDLIDKPLPATAEPTPSAWRRVRLANRDDEPEFLRLFELMAEERGFVDYDRHRVMAQFDRAVSHNRCELIVADGKDGGLIGFALIGMDYVWFSPAAQQTLLGVFVEREHRETARARILTRFSEQPAVQFEQSIERLASMGSA
jgi:hypothetical protein